MYQHKLCSIVRRGDHKTDLSHKCLPPVIFKLQAKLLNMSLPKPLSDELSIEQDFILKTTFSTLKFLIPSTY